MSHEAQSSRGDVEVDVGALLRSVFRALPFIIVIAGAVAVATLLFLATATPKYRAETRILIETGESRLTRPDSPDQNLETLLDEGGIRSQVQLITSRDLARVVSEKLDLASRPEFNPDLGGNSFLTELLITLGLKSDDGGSAGDEGVLERFYDHLTVYPIEGSRVIAVEFTANDPDLAARAANLVAGEYIELQRLAKREDTDDAARFLETEIEKLRQRVAEAELEAAKFRAGSDLFQGGQNNDTLAEQQLTELNTELGRVRAVRADAEAKAAQIRQGLQGGAALETSDVLNSPLIQRLRERQVALRARIAELSATYLPAHPRMQELNAQLADEGAQFRAEALKIVRGLEKDAELSRAREEQIHKELAQLKAAAARSDTAAVELRALEREATAQRELLESYLGRYRDAVARQGGDYQPADARIISQAVPPAAPYFPKTVPTAAMAAAATVFLLLVLVVVRELASGRPMRQIGYPAPLPAEPDAVQVDGHVRWQEGSGVRRVLPVGAVAPANSTETLERSLATIAKRIAGNAANRVLVTRAHVSEPAGGRPLAAVALARSLSRLGSRVVLVDLVRDNATHQAMGEDGDMPGLTDIYAGTAAFAQAIFRDRGSSAHFIPTGRADVGDDELATERLSTIFDALAHTYDHVIFDADESMIEVLAGDCNAIVLVSEAGAADPRTVRVYDQIAGITAGDVMLLVVDPMRSDEDAAGAAA